MKVEIIAFGIAKDILQGKKLSLDFKEGISIAEVKAELISLYPDFQNLASLQIAVNADYVPDDYIIQTNDEVVLIPPVSGG